MSMVNTPDLGEDRGAPRRSTGRGVVSVLLILALGATALTRSDAISARIDAIDSAKPKAASATVVSSSSLDAMPSFATALLLGGLRGPLVMMLWTSSESQKQEHQLEDFDTKVEWIRLLQPEFDTVHLFQIWNKAYNISVQMANLTNKYATIIDAIDYAQKVDQEKPDDISIISAMASLYGDKLGDSQEHVYYRRRVRRETQTLVRVTFPAARSDEFRNVAGPIGWIEDEAPLLINAKAGTVHTLLEKTQADQILPHFSGPDVTTDNLTYRQSQQTGTARRDRLDSLLNIDGDILPELLVPRFPRPADLAADEPWYDGSELQYLGPYLKPNGPSFPYGVPVQALEFNYYKRAQELQTLWNERHVQSGDAAVDGRAPLALERWGKDEWERGRRFELRFFGHPMSVNADPIMLEGPDSVLKLDQPTHADADREAALYSYGLASRLWSEARSEIRRHVKAYTETAQVFQSHLDDCTANEAMMSADRDYLAATTATGSQREALINSATQHYIEATQRYSLIILKYYVDDAVVVRVYPQDPRTGQTFPRSAIEQIDPSAYLPLLRNVESANAKFFRDPGTGQYSVTRDQYHDQREEYRSYITHCQTRLALIAAMKPAPKAK